eukprot:TRINITY_DN1716_c1_g1_i2.p1 TRINITY_DN1716_c1_g1~~TRINITY_DN1716_c1_g1_i2.p1  ORF type:complete len:841 (+),score=219.08 TRINITY_DN1716_c1_g1_i2:43-2565(+)
MHAQRRRRRMQGGGGAACVYRMVCDAQETGRGPRNVGALGEAFVAAAGSTTADDGEGERLSAAETRRNKIALLIAKLHCLPAEGAEDVLSKITTKLTNDMSPEKHKEGLLQFHQCGGVPPLMRLLFEMENKCQSAAAPDSAQAPTTHNSAQRTPSFGVTLNFYDVTNSTIPLTLTNAATAPAATSAPPQTAAAAGASENTRSGGNLTQVQAEAEAMSLLSSFITGTSPDSRLVLLQNHCLVILRELCYFVTDAGDDIARNDRFVQLLFRMLRNPLTFNNSVGLLEEVLAARPKGFCLTKINNFQEFVCGLSVRRMSFFCRILAQLIFDPERFTIEAPRSRELIQLKSLEELEKPLNIDINQAIICGTPDILDKLVKLLRAQQLSFGNWVEQLMQQFPSTADILLLLGLQDDVGWDTVGPNPPANLSPADVSLNAFALATHQVELLFVLCALLGGKRKFEVQDKLARLGLIPALNSLYFKIPWGAPETHNAEHGVHGPGCECNPDTSLKVQFLRVILNFCDKDTTYKLLLLSESELESLHCVQLETFRKVMPNALIKDKDGLLAKVAKTLRVLPENSNFKFWMASCVEGFCRNVEPVCQTWLVQLGILDFVICELGAGTWNSNALQTDFDLMGELIKFNRHAFYSLDVLMEDDTLFDTISKTMVTNLVDSNVFLRSLILSSDAFKKEDTEAKRGAFSMAGHRLFRFVEQNVHNITETLLGILTVEDVTQENICCLNTTLLLLETVRRHSDLTIFVNEIKRRVENGGGAAKVRALFKNFIELLDFWRRYYATRGTDRLGLETSSRVPFEAWQETAEAARACLAAVLNEEGNAEATETHGKSV